MYDMNFFSSYKRKQTKNSTFTVFLIILVSVFLLLNGALLGGRKLIFDRINNDIETKQAYIVDPATQQQIVEANKTKQQADISSNYLLLLQSISTKLGQMNRTNTGLIDQILLMTPATTSYSFFEINGINIMIECQSSVVEDPIDMYHAFLSNGLFASVSLSGITQTADGLVTFTVICKLAGGSVS